MAAWPELDELKQVLDVTSTEWDGDYDGTRLTRLLAAAIEKVKSDVGDWDDYIDVPDDNLSQAALRMAELIALKPEVAAAVASGKMVGDPAYLMLIFGHRRAFGVA
jgi:hypothetical protein